MKRSDVFNSLLEQALYLVSVASRDNDFNFHGFVALRSAYSSLCSYDTPEYLLFSSYVEASMNGFFVGPLPFEVV